MTIPAPALPATPPNGRQRVARLLAHATAQELQAAWGRLADKPDARPVRGPETGLGMVRGRIGGEGAPFNLGAATVTRATVLLPSGTAGRADALRPNKAQARRAALFAAPGQAPTSPAS